MNEGEIAVMTTSKTRIRKNLHDLPLWAVLAQNIYSLQGQLLLTKGTVLKPNLVEKLMASGITEVYLEESQEEETPAAVHNRNLEGAIRVGQVIISDVLNQVREVRSINSDDLREAVDIFYPEVIASTNVFSQLLKLRDKDEYTAQHSIAVGAIGVKICQLLGLPQDKAKMVGMAGVMHDIGKVRLPDSVLNKPYDLTAEEWEQMKKHPQYGYEILRSMKDIAPEIQLAVLQHHERLDGSGYPLGLTANKIHLFSRILAIADSFDAMTTERVYHPPRSTFDTSKELMTQAFRNQLDIRIVIRFINYLLDLSPGQKVVLNTGEIAEVILVNKSEPTRPLVQVGDRFFNLQQTRDVWIDGLITG